MLTGLLDDGAAGMCDEKERGGLAIVQDLRYARYPDMPKNARARSAVDYVLRLQEIPAVTARLASAMREPQDDSPVSRQLEIETRIALEENPIPAGVLELGPASPYSCPDCHGVLRTVGTDDVTRCRCHTGHAYSIDTLLATQLLTAENAIWNALRAIEEQMMLMSAMTELAQGAGLGAGSSHPV